MLQQHIFCDRNEVPQLTCDRSSKPLRCFKRACVVGTCTIINLGGGTIAQRKCGWEARAPKFKLLWSEQPHRGFRYEPTQFGNDKETKQPIISDEFRPVFGTLSKFIEGSIAKLELFSPHKHDDRIQRNNLHRSLEQIMAEKKKPTVGMLIADYAA